MIPAPTFASVPMTTYDEPQKSPAYFDADAFRSLGHELVDLLADQFENHTGKVLDFKTSDELYAQWQSDYFENDNANSSLPAMFERVIGNSIRLHHPNYMGHQISPVAHVSALASLVADTMNNGMGVYEMGMAGTVLERLVIELTGRQFGFGDRCGGVLTSGGSLGNLTALLTAQNIVIDSISTNADDNHKLRPALMVSENAHYCVQRAVKIMGWGDSGVIKVPVNEHFQMDVSQLDRMLSDATESGLQVIAIVGSACSTATGSYDDLAAIGEFCDTHDLWFHVDGAHGAAAAFAPKYRSLIRGIELADSVVLDYHKLLLTPALTTALVFRNVGHNYQTFSQKAEYLFAEDGANRPWQDVAMRSFECTKLMMSLKVFSIYHSYRLTAWEQNVTAVYDLARKFAAMIQQRDGLQLLVTPESNIVCYRFLADAQDRELNNRINAAIRKQVLTDGDFYIVQTEVNQNIWLRSTLGNAKTSESNLTALMDSIERIGNSLLNSQ
jgi:L-2,4-diaminobutyrate decarboxylase